MRLRVLFVSIPVLVSTSGACSRSSATEPPTRRNTGDEPDGRALASDAGGATGPSPANGAAGGTDEPGAAPDDESSTATGGDGPTDPNAIPGGGGGRSSPGDGDGLPRGGGSGGVGLPPSNGSGDDSSTSGAAGASAACGFESEHCFEPCEGDRSGNWVLEEACFVGGSLLDCPSSRLSGLTLDARLLMSVPDGDGSPDVAGRVAWELFAELAPSCLGLGGEDACATKQLFIGPTGPPLTSISRTFLDTCESLACGACRCSGVANEDPRSLARDLSRAPYCVDRDVLWVGGTGENGESKVSYKFRRMSCGGVPVPCAERTAAQCDAGGDCRLGSCHATSGEAPECEQAESQSHCQTLDGCTWDPEQCTGSARCRFATCDSIPGCALGPPVAPRCTGEVSCGGQIPANECTAPGCSVQACAGTDAPRSCEDIPFEDVCPLAPGCVWDGSSCTGTTDCAQQTVEDACRLLRYCDWGSFCVGTPEGACSDLSAEDCHSRSGCFLEW